MQINQTSMNPTGIPIDEVRTLLGQSKGILIATRRNPTIDSMASSLSLYLALTSSGKQTTVVCESDMTVELSSLVGVDKVKNDISSGTGKNLVISFPYQEGSIEKVSYNIDNGLFNLVIEPREGFPQIRSDAIQFSQEGTSSDLIISVDARNLSELGNIYSVHSPLFGSAPIINIDSHSGNQMFGKVNIVNTNTTSTAEVILSFLTQLGHAIDADIATNLLAGISEKTDNFSSSSTTAQTFEAAAVCLRNGARNVSKPQPFPPVQKPYQFPQTPKPQGVRTSPSRQKYPQGPQYTPPPFDSGKSPAFSDYTQQFNDEYYEEETKPLKYSQQNEKSGSTMQGKWEQPIPEKSTQPKQQDPTASDKSKNVAPPDWLKPKIYKGSTLL